MIDIGPYTTSPDSQKKPLKNKVLEAAIGVSFISGGVYGGDDLFERAKDFESVPLSIVEVGGVIGSGILALAGLRLLAGVPYNNQK